MVCNRIRRKVRQSGNFVKRHVMKTILISLALLTFGSAAAQTDKPSNATPQPTNPPVMTAPANPSSTPTLDTRKGTQAKQKPAAPVGQPPVDQTRAASPSGVERPKTGNPNNPATDPVPAN